MPRNRVPLRWVGKEATTAPATVLLYGNLGQRWGCSPIRLSGLPQARAEVAAATSESRGTSSYPAAAAHDDRREGARVRPNLPSCLPEAKRQ